VADPFAPFADQLAVLVARDGGLFEFKLYPPNSGWTTGNTVLPTTYFRPIRRLFRPDLGVGSANEWGCSYLCGALENGRVIYFSVSQWRQNKSFFFHFLLPQYCLLLNLFTKILKIIEKGSVYTPKKYLDLNIFLI
jgi:hypothetical protein